MNNEANHYSSLDLLRGISGYGVAVSHYFAFLHGNQKFEYISFLFVEFFFILSGYVLFPQLIKVFNNKKKGLGGAINTGILNSSGNFVTIMMADRSDDIEDLKKYYRLIKFENLDAILGSRFLKESKVSDYPIQKLILNRIFNFFVSLIFFNKYNDYTNAFKIYKKDVLKTLMPFVSESFNIFLEIPLKIIGRGYSYRVIKINWYGRKKGEAKFKIKELRSKYIFTLLYCLLEKILLKIEK